MEKVIVDAGTLQKLRNLREELRLFDELGNLLGTFTPVKASAPEKLMPTISEEELQRREETGGGRSLQEILADLERNQ